MKSIDSSKKSNKNALLFILILGITFFMMYLLNTNTHFTSDDYRYHYMYEEFMPTEDVKRVSNIEDLAVSMYNHYNLWGGRIPAHIFVQGILMFEKSVFNIVNSLGFVLLAVLIYLHSANLKKLNASLMLFIVGMMWFFIPQFGATILWVSGAGNYLWCSILIFTMLLPYRLYASNQNIIKDNILSILIITALGLFAGWTNENTGGAMVLLQIFFIGYYYLNKIKIPKWSISGLITSIIGLAILVVAPGNYTRPNKDVSFIKRLGGLAGNSFEVMLIPLIILIVLSIILYTQKKKNIKVLTIPIMYLIVSIAGVGALIMTQYAPQRTWFGPIIFIIIAIGYVYSRIDFTNIRINNIKNIGIIILAVATLISYTNSYKDIKTTHNQIMKQVETIELEKEKGNKEVTVKQITNPKTSHNAYKHTAKLTQKSDSWFNSWMAKYYGVDYINGVE